MEIFSNYIIDFMSSVPESLQLFVLFLFSFAEGIPVVGSILPGGTIAIFAGSLAQQGILPLVPLILVIGFASFFGDMTGFFIGRKFKHFKWIRKIVENEKHQKSWDLFDRHMAIITIFGKLIPIVRSTPCLFAAVRGVRVRRYIRYSFIGSMLWAVVGVYAGKAFTSFFGDKSISLIFGIVLISIGIVVVRIFIKQIIRKHKSKKYKNA